MNPEHRPKSHQAHPEWTPSRIIGWAKKTGPNTAALVQKILKAKCHPEMGYRSCLGIIRLAGRYPVERVEAASQRALRCNTTGYKSVSRYSGSRFIGKVDTGDGTRPNARKRYARAHAWQEMLDSGQYRSIREMAKDLGVCHTYMARLLRFTILAPEIIEAILDGREPEGLSQTKLTGAIPADWEEQRRRWRFEGRHTL